MAYSSIKTFTAKRKEAVCVQRRIKVSTPDWASSVPRSESNATYNHGGGTPKTKHEEHSIIYV